MKFKSIRVLNYKGFEDLGWIDLGEAFTAIIGANNAGKTALLEAFRLNQNPARPHRTPDRRRGQPGPMQSRFEVVLVPSQHELRDAFLESGGELRLPVSKDDQHAPRDAIEKFFRGEDVAIRFGAEAGAGFSSLGYPSHGMFKRDPAAYWTLVRPKGDRRGLAIEDRSFGGEDDNVLDIVARFVSKKTFVFRAERLNVATAPFGEARELQSDARNLPLVLLWLQTNPTAWERFNRHVNEVFPTIRRVVVNPKGGNLEILLWMLDPATEREDLAISLAECGTGIGQVLAILFVAMTLDECVIVVDEPNSFLHPGAAKALVRILALYRNQYVIATHSTDLLSTANPSHVVLLRWNKGASAAIPIDLKSIDQQRQILAEVGIAPSDLFGIERVVWVEGPTEAECFPLLLQRKHGAVPTGVAFRAVRSVDEVARRAREAVPILDIYKRLTEAAAVMPEAIAFSFDREGRSQEQIDRLMKESGGLVRFLPLRCFENYLLHPAALAAVMSAEANLYSLANVEEKEVRDWIGANGQKYGDPVGVLDVPTSEAPLVDGAKLLSNLFQDLRKLTYSKIDHGAAITRWLLDNDMPHLIALIAYVDSLAPGNEET